MLIPERYGGVNANMSSISSLITRTRNHILLPISILRSLLYRWSLFLCESHVRMAFQMYGRFWPKAGEI
jgi:hypothetical protein